MTRCSAPWSASRSRRPDPLPAHERAGRPAPDLSLRRITDGVFRAAPRLELLPSRRLSRPLRASLGALGQDAYGVLRSRASPPVNLAAICHNTARLFRALQRPGRLPALVTDGDPDGGNLVVATLVLDGLLELETDRGFVSGADAFPHVFDGPPAPLPRHRTGRLSVEALQYGHRLGLTDAGALTARLYRYHTLPASPRLERWEPLLVTAVRSLLARPAPPATAPWRPPRWPASTAGWLAWTRIASAPERGRPETPCKLYLSPACDDLLEVLPLAVDILLRSRATAFKLGNGLSGVLRPDKLVAYFSRFADLLETARVLEASLAGTRAHGVPFTASLTSDGLLSWGRDPAPRVRTRWWEAGESWRWWVTGRLAGALLVASRARAGSIEPWRFALQRLRLDGVDSETFAPGRPAG